MKKILSILLIFLCLGCASYAAPPENYEGFGRVTEGHLSAPNEWDTYDVSNTDDSGAGSLRDAVSEPNRLIEFSVGGTITLESELRFRSCYTTIDGSTAPDPGITISGWETSFNPADGGDPVNNIIVSNIRFEDSTDDLLALWGSFNVISKIIIDHCTFVNSGDGVLDTTGLVSEVTQSWNLIMDNTLAQLIAGKTDQNEPPLEKLSVHHNLYVGNHERQPQLKRELDVVDWVNNVIYGWGSGGYGLAIREPNDQYQYAEPLYEIEYPKANIENNVIHHTGVGNDYSAIYWPYPLVGEIYFNGNIVPDNEDDNVSSSAQHEIAEANQVTMYAANTLGNTVVPYVGTHYPTQDEIDIMDEVSKGLGGDGYPPAEEGTYLVAKKEDD